MALVLALAALAACGKSRLRGDDVGENGWDEPTAANGFHGEADSACRRPCVPRGEAGRPKHAVRASPEPRVIATLEEPSRVGLVFWHQSCLEGASTRDWEAGTWWCLDPREGKTHPLVEHGPPSAMGKTAHSMFLATRDVNGRSEIRSGKTVLVAGETDVRALAALGDELCWIDANERVRCATDSGGARDVRESIRTVARAPGIDARFLAMDDEAFYVVNGGTISRLARGADRLERLATIDAPMRDFALVDGHVLWTEHGEARTECSTDGTWPSCTSRGRTIRHPFGALRRVRIADRKSTTLAGDLDDADGLLLVKEHAYVSTGQGLVRVPLNGGAATILPTGDPAIGRPALDPVSWTVYVQTRKNAEPAKVVAVEP